MARWSEDYIAEREGSLAFKTEGRRVKVCKFTAFSFSQQPYKRKYNKISVRVRDSLIAT